MWYNKIHGRFVFQNRRRENRRRQTKASILSYLISNIHTMFESHFYLVNVINECGIHTKNTLRAVFIFLLWYSSMLAMRWYLIPFMFLWHCRTYRHSGASSTEHLKTPDTTHDCLWLSCMTYRHSGASSTEHLKTPDTTHDCLWLSCQLYTTTSSSKYRTRL